MSSRIIRPTRRQILQCMGLAGASGAAGCIADPNAQSGISNIHGDGTVPESGSADSLGLGQEALGEIEHIVVLMMENRSFDHVFGALSMAAEFEDHKGNLILGEGRSDVNGLTGNETNVDLDGNEVRVHRLTEMSYGDIAHEWEDNAKQIAFDGERSNDGFVRRHQQDVEMQPQSESYCQNYEHFKKFPAECAPVDMPMGVYCREDLDVYYTLADNFAICDAWFSSAPAPTWPNRFYLHAGTAGGIQNNRPLIGHKTIWNQLRDNKIKCANFYCDVPLALTAFGENLLTANITIGDGMWGGILEPFQKRGIGLLEGLTVNSFEEYVESGTLPAFSVIEPGYSSGFDDHPPAPIDHGQIFVSIVYNILRSNPEVWKKTLFIITYDEHGSIYDHVVPPGRDARYSLGEFQGDPMSHTYDDYEAFRQSLGVRVPAIVVGHHVRRGYVSKLEYEHTSILRTVSDRFLDGNYLNERVRHSNSLADCLGGPTSGAAPPPLPQHELSEIDMMDWAAEPFPDGQPAANDYVGNLIPYEADLRRDRQEHVLGLLELGEKYGALKLTR